MKHKWNYKLYGHCKVRHHLLEILLWPNNDGTFRIIHNSMNKLKELGIYDDYKLTIEITASEHSKLHGNNRSDEWNERASISHKGKERMRLNLIKAKQRRKNVTASK